MTAPKNPRLSLPVSIPGSEALANQERANALIQRNRGSRPAITGLTPAAALPFERTADAARTAGERRQDALRESYLVSDTTPSKVDLSSTDVPGYMQLDVTEIDAYDHNPRLWRNEKFDEIYNSIKENGFTGSLTVTRRRVGDRYMLAAGSNTTLEIIKDLWAKTRDEKYRWVNCIFQPYESETRLLAQHLGENLNRGDMRFWEVAKGACNLIAQIEADTRAKVPDAKPLSIRDRVEALASSGIKVQKTTVQLWSFAVDRLVALGPATARLTAKAVEVINPRLSALRGLSEKFRLSDEDFWHTVVDPVLERYAQDLELANEDVLDAGALCDRMESEFAVHVNESLASVRQMLSLLKLAPALTLADLRLPSPILVAGGHAATDSTGTADASPDLQGGSPAAAAANWSEAKAGAEGAQAPLPLPPGQVRGAGASPPAGSRPSTRPAKAEGAGSSEPASAASPAGGQPGLFTVAEGDPLQALHAAVERLLGEVGLSDTLRYRDEMPLGFFIELPDRERHARSRVQLYTPEHYARMAKSMVWWTLVYMTGQFREGAVPFMDHSSQFFHHFSSDDGTDPLAGTDVENQQPDPHELQIHRILPGALREATRQVRVVEELAAQVLEKIPERLQRLLLVYKSQA